MKRDITILMITLLAVMLSCNSDDKGQGNKGKLRIGVTTNTSVITKAEETVKADSIRLTVKNMDSGWSKEYAFVTADLTTEEIELASGPYELTAATGSTNNGFAGFDTPYYMGKDTVYIQAEQTTTANIECTLTTVKVAVYYDSSVGNVYLKDYKTVVRDESGELSYTKEESRDGFFAPGYLSVDFMYQDNTENWQTIHLENIAEAKAREYYKIQISADKNDDNEEGDSEGAANITITVGETNPKDITIGIALPKVTLTTDKIADDKIEYTKVTLSGSYLTPSGTTPKTPMFYYREKKEPAATWSEIAAASTRAATTYNYTAEAINLSAGTEYEYKFMEKGNVVSFTTKELMEVNDATDVDVNSATLHGKYVGKSKVPLFYYKKSNDADWASVSAVLNGDNLYKAELINISPKTEYVFKLEQSEEKSFTTLKEPNITLGVFRGATNASLYGELAASNQDESSIYFRYRAQNGTWQFSEAAQPVMAGSNQYKVILDKLQVNTTYEYQFSETSTIRSFNTFQTAPSVSKVVAGADYAHITCQMPGGVSAKDSILWVMKGVGSTESLAVEMVLANGDITNGQFEKTFSGLEQNGTYYVSEDSKQFTTLYNASFETWSQSGKIIYPGAQSEANANNSFWDSGNKGASTLGKNPTTEEKQDLPPGHTGSAAMLQSQFVGFLTIGKFAAGNMFIGKFIDRDGMGGKLDFGRSFETRPTQLRGWYKYSSPKTVDHSETDKLKKGAKDLCAIYAVLTDVDGNGESAFNINTNNTNTFIDYKTHSNTIGYGELADEACRDVPQWTQFNIDINYKNGNIPKYLIITASASKYGDYFTGSTKSVMYIDDFELVYDYTKPPYTNN